MIPEDLLYTKEHEWLKVEGDTGTVGITHFAQDKLGDIVYVELPEVGDNLEQFSEFGAVESVKAVSDLFAPISGEILEINEDLADAPELLNEAPYSDGWLVKMRIENVDELDGLLSSTDYSRLIEEEDGDEESAVAAAAEAAASDTEEVEEEEAEEHLEDLEELEDPEGEE